MTSTAPFTAMATVAPILTTETIRDIVKERQDFLQEYQYDSCKNVFLDIDMSSPLCDETFIANMLHYNEEHRPVLWQMELKKDKIDVVIERVGMMCLYSPSAYVCASHIMEKKYNPEYKPEQLFTAKHKFDKNEQGFEMWALRSYSNSFYHLLQLMKIRMHTKHIIQK